MKRLHCLANAFLFILSSAVYAYDKEPSLEQKLHAIKLEKMQAEFMILRMQKSGRLNHEEAELARREVASVKEEDKIEMRKEVFDNTNFSKSFANK